MAADIYPIAISLEVSAEVQGNSPSDSFMNSFRILSDFRFVCIFYPYLATCDKISMHCSDPCKLSEPPATIQQSNNNNWPESNVGVGTSQRIVTGRGCAEFSYECESDSDGGDGLEIPPGPSNTDSQNASYSDDEFNSSIASVGKAPSSQVPSRPQEMNFSLLKIPFF